MPVQRYTTKRNVYFPSFTFLLITEIILERSQQFNLDAILLGIEDKTLMSNFFGFLRDVQVNRGDPKIIFIAKC